MHHHIHKDTHNISTTGTCTLMEEPAM